MSRYTGCREEKGRNVFYEIKANKIKFRRIKINTEIITLKKCKKVTNRENHDRKFQRISLELSAVDKAVIKTNVVLPAGDMSRNACCNENGENSSKSSKPPC